MDENSYICGVDERVVSLGAGSGVVTDISSGKEMSLEEFDRALGLHTALEVRPDCFPSLEVPSWQAPHLQPHAAKGPEANRPSISPDAAANAWWVDLLSGIQARACSQ